MDTDTLQKALQEQPGQILLGSSCKLRIAAWLQILKDLPIHKDSAIVQKWAQLLFRTYNNYSDAQSRLQAQKALLGFVEQDRKFLIFYVNSIYDVAQASTNLAVMDLLTLLAWTHELDVAINCKDAAAGSDSNECTATDTKPAVAGNPAESPSTSSVASKLIAASVLLLASAVDSGSHLHASHKIRLVKSALAHLKHSFMRVLASQHIAHQKAYIDLCVRISLECKSPSAAILFLGVLSDAVHDLLPTHPSLFEHLSTHASAVVKFFCSLVVLGKSSPSPNALKEFSRHFLKNYVSSDIFAKLILPDLEKAVLKSSEFGFCQLSIYLFDEPDAIDLSSSLASSKFLSQLMAGLKSNKEHVREAASVTFINIFKTSLPSVSHSDLTTILGEVTKCFKATTNTDCKALIAEMFGAFSSKMAALIQELAAAILPLAAKEQNEQTLASLLNVLSEVLVNALADEIAVDEMDKIISQFNAGLESSKLPLRSVWASSIGEQLMSNDQSNPRLIKLYQTLRPSFVKGLAEANKSPLLSITNKGVTVAYVYLALSGHFSTDEESFASVLDISNEKFSILLSTKAITKLSFGDQSWCLKALLASFAYVTEKQALDFALALLYFAISKHVNYAVRLEASNAFVKLLNVNELVLVTSIVQAIDEIVASTEDSVDSELGYGLQFFPPVFNNLLQSCLKQGAEQILVKLFVIAHHEQIAVKDAWIGLVLRSSLDPFQVIANHVQEITNIILTVLETYPEDSFHAKAASSALSTFSFVYPEACQNEIAKALKADLSVENLLGIDSDAIAIWRATEGEVVVDVLEASKPKRVEDKNSKDYETRKWEESLKKEISAKKSTLRKLTREEQALVNEQLAKESSIRANINAIIKRFIRAFTIITTFSGNSDSLNTGGLLWYSTSVFDLLELLRHPLSHELFGEKGTLTFIAASNEIKARLNPLAEMTGAITLRLYAVKGIPERYTQQLLLDSLSTILFRIKMLVDDWFTVSGYIYIAPLIIKVMENGKAVALANSKKQKVTSEFSNEDPEEEHLSLAISILSAQNMLEHEFIPRRPILESIIALMKVPTHAKMAKECFSTVCQHISVNYTLVDLEMLLLNLVIPDSFVKNAILQSIDAEFDLTEDLTYSDELWLTMHDTDNAVAELSRTIWDESDFSVPPESPQRLLAYIDQKDSGLRLTVAKSIASAIEVLSENDMSVYSHWSDKLLKLFKKLEVPPPAEKDKFGLAINTTALSRDPWESRSTIAIALRFLSPLCKSSQAVEAIFTFLVQDETLGDKEELVAQELLEAGTEIIRQSGAENVEVLIQIFETCLAKKDENSRKQDKIKELVIILYGSLGRHLAADDSRLHIIFDRLLRTLDTPSEDVQFAISECIAPLVASFQANLQDTFEKLLEKLWNGKTLAERKGAAYGIAGLVKGAGIKSLFKNDVMREISAAADNKKDEKVRESVSFVFDCLSQVLGSMFEPYVIEVLPIILKFLGDASPQVREATDLAARQFMKSTTSYGIKQLIPLAIRNLDDIAWRSKKGSVELLGSMAYLDPTQLSASLSIIVPEIVGVLNDTHKEVRKAADQSLKRFGEVIRNPEIQTIVPDLIKAIGDPTKYTEDALDKLIKTQFVHYIDGPSLALIIHVIHRGMRERSASTKKKACQIVGNMAILVDSNDLLPYLPSLVAELEVAMVDPVPETRSTGARALGSLVEKLGEDRFSDLIPRLTRTLNDPTKAGDRLGSAQALAEVIAGLGLSKLDEMLPSILSNAQSPYNHVRAGYVPMLLYLPVCFGSQFAPYLSQIIPPILHGLADTDEEIRGTALKAGRLIVKNYASKAIDLLLPELEQGMADSSYRIRLSSVELTGDLLFQVTGISGKNELTEEQLEVNRNLVDVLGLQRRDRILASIYVCRSDVTSVVRAASIDIWKALVANTPKTVKEIIPSLTQMLVKRLASSDETHRTIAASTLGDVVRRVGANALAQLLPTMEDLLVSSDSDGKQGICFAAAELINSANTDALERFQETFIAIIRDALMDLSAGVRAAAAQAFEALQGRIGKVVIDEILPYLLNQLETADSENALMALEDIMATKADVVFPILIPTLMTPPIDMFKTRALSSLASVAGPALYSRLGAIINTLIQAVIDARKSGDAETLDDANKAFDKMLLSINDDAGLHPVMQQLMALIKHQDPEKRAAITQRLAVFFANTHLDYQIYVQDLVSQLIFYLGDKDQNVVQGVFEALFSLVKAQDKPTLEQLVKPAHQALTIAGVKNENLAGFTLARGPSCVLPIFSHGLMYGTAEQKELSALSLAEIIDRTPPEILKPFATPITGPLIRVIGERVSSDIKTAILAALTSLLRRIPQFLRPFIPQLQRTFVRSLMDPSNDRLRSGAVEALGLLIEFQPRVDSLVTELVAAARAAEDSGIKNSLLKAMLQVVLKGGKNMSEASKTSVMTLVEHELNGVTDQSAVAYARLLGSLSQVMSSEEAASVLRNKVLSKRHDTTEMKFAILALNSFLRDAPAHVFHTGLLGEVVAFILDCSAATSPYISDNATVALGKLLLLQGERKLPKQEPSVAELEPFDLPLDAREASVKQLAALACAPASSSADTRRLALIVIRTVARLKKSECLAPFLDVVAPAVFSCLRDAIIPIRLAAEKAYLTIFGLVEDVDQVQFKQWFERVSQAPLVVGSVTIQPRSIGDYTKRVASRLASVERERLEAGGDAETMFSDRFEDESEVWSFGGA